MKWPVGKGQRESLKDRGAVFVPVGRSRSEDFIEVLQTTIRARFGAGGAVRVPCRIRDFGVSRGSRQCVPRDHNRRTSMRITPSEGNDPPTGSSYADVSRAW